MKISFVIPAKNEGSLIGECINSIKSSVAERYKYEILVISDSSFDNTDTIAKQQNCKLYKVEFLNRSKTRNYGFHKSNGEIIFFIDADTIISKNLVSNTIKQIQSKNKSVVYFKQRNLEKNAFSSLYFYFINFISKFRPTFCPVIAIKRSYINDNPFNPKLKSLEDLFFLHKAFRNKKTFYCKETVYTSIRRVKKFGIFYSTFLLLQSFINPYKYNWKPIN